MRATQNVRSTARVWPASSSHCSSGAIDSARIGEPETAKHQTSGTQIQRYATNDSVNQANHWDWRYWFWMDLASAHYPRATTDFLEQQGIRFVPKEANPLSVVSMRPVENFWAAVK